MHKARDDLTNKKPTIYRVQQDKACFSVQHIVTEGFVLKESGNNNPVSARMSAQASVSQTEKPWKNIGRIWTSLDIKTLHLPTQFIRVFHASRTANAHFCQQNSRIGFYNRADVCLQWGRNCNCMRVLFEDEREENLGRGRKKAAVLQRKWGTNFDSEDSEAVPANAYTEGSLERRYNIVTLRGYGMWCDLSWGMWQKREVERGLSSVRAEFLYECSKGCIRSI